MIEITIIDHARKSMAERGVTDDEVRDCVLHPQQVVSQANGRDLYKRRTVVAGKPMY